MRNERYCGDVLTRKRFTKFAADVHDQKSFKNRGEKPQSHYRDDHEAIIDRNDFLAVQRIMNNARFGGTSLLPELQVIPDGLLKGFVIVHPKWGSFTKEDYIAACRSVDSNPEDERRLEVREGSFDLTGYEVADFKLFSDQSVPAIMLHKDSIAFSVAAIREMDLKDNYVELLVHPLRKESLDLAIKKKGEEGQLVSIPVDRISKVIAVQISMSYNSVESYGMLAKFLDEIAEKDEAFFTALVENKIVVSFEKMRKFAQMDETKLIDIRRTRKASSAFR